MAELSDIQNEFIRDEIEEFIEREGMSRHSVRLVLGALYNVIWNHLTNSDAQYGVKDI